MGHRPLQAKILPSSRCQEDSQHQCGHWQRHAGSCKANQNIMNIIITTTQQQQQRLEQ